MKDGTIFFLTTLLIETSILKNVIQPTSANLLRTLCPTIPSQPESLYDFPVSVEVTYLDVSSARRQRILFSKYHNFLLLYNRSDFVKMHMHNAWLLGKSNVTICLPSDYFIEPKYLFVFCGTLKLNEICDNRDANNFDFHSFLFTASYLMINNSFMLQILKRSGNVSFRLNDTILPTLYFVCGIKDLPCQAFRHRFLNFERQNEPYQQHFFKYFLGRGHCTKTYEICIRHDSVHYSHVNYELSHFKG